MEVLREMLEVAKYNDFEAKALLLERDLNTLLARHQDNPVTDLGSNNLDVKFEEALKRLNAAKSALSIVNKLGTQIKQAQDPTKKAKLVDFKKQNVSRIMKNLNVLRLMVKHLGEELAKSNQASAGVPQVGSRVHEDANPNNKFKKLKDEAKKAGVAKKELGKNPFGKKKVVKEDADEEEETSIKKEVKDAVKKSDVAKSELKKNPFDKNKKPK